MRYARPNTEGSKVRYASRYGNFIGGEFVKPVKGQYFENPSPVTGQPFCEIPRSTKEDIELALDAAHGAKTAWENHYCRGLAEFKRSDLGDAAQRPRIQ